MPNIDSVSCGYLVVSLVISIYQGVRGFVFQYYNSKTYYYSDVLDFDSSGHSETFFSMRLIGNIITARMIPDNFDCSL